MEQGKLIASYSRLYHVRTRPYCLIIVIKSGLKLSYIITKNLNFRRPKNEILSSIKKVDTVQIHRIHHQARRFLDHVMNLLVMHRRVLQQKLKQVVHVQLHHAQVQLLPRPLLS